MQVLEDIKKKRKSRQENEKERLWEKEETRGFSFIDMYKMGRGEC
jgi:hypothetical protein